MHAALKIREAVAAVWLLRRAGDADPALHRATQEIKRLQARRFAGTYADLLAGRPHAAAARFFLEELYNDKDYTERDAQFARIAGAIETLFPAQVAGTAVSLAQLHALTEVLDQALAIVWMASASTGRASAQRYVAAWREVGRRTDRQAQLTVVVEIGEQMVRLTRTPGLRIMLRMMRGPASAAGLGALQRFLETGFDTFSAMARQPRSAEAFLGIVQERESALLAMLFDEAPDRCVFELERILGQAR